MKFKSKNKLITKMITVLMISGSLLISGAGMAHANPTDEALNQNIQELNDSDNGNTGNVNDANNIKASNTAEDAETDNSTVEIINEERALKTAGMNGWKQENGAWYYYKNGQKARGWLKLDSRWYYLLNTNKMADNMWRKIKGHLYFFKPGGIMAANETLNVNGKYYTFNQHGHIVVSPQSAGHKKGQLQGSQAQIEAVLSTARAQLGKPYVWGATGPNSFDCSGFTSYSYRVGAGINIPRVSRDQARAGQYVSRENLQPGDLVFFGRGNYVSHVGMYIGNQQYMHAPQPGDVVKVSSLKGVRTITQRRYIKARYGWVQENGRWAYYRNDQKVTGWLEVDGNRYYMDDNGYMEVATWIRKGDDFYYVNRHGIALSNITTSIRGQQYTFGADGRMVK